MQVKKHLLSFVEVSYQSDCWPRSMEKKDFSDIA